MPDAERGRIGLLGGTFNPPHVGHLVCAQEALDQLGLDRVVLVPVHTPPHKQAAGDPGPDVRVELCRLAVAGDERLDVSTIEVDRGGPSFTVDTLRAIHATSPEADLTFIVGGDMAQSLPSWREPEAVLELAQLGVAERDGAPRADILKRLATVRGGVERARFFDMPRIDVSSSLLRRRAAAGRSIRYLVPAGVAEYVTRNGLYATPAGSPIP